jgi:hypothetical protein
MVFAYIGSNNKLEIEENLIRKALERIVEKKEKISRRYEGKKEISASATKILM